MAKSFVESWTNVIKSTRIKTVCIGLCKGKKRNKLNNALFLRRTHKTKTDLTSNVNYVWSDKNNGITQVWGPAPFFEADFLLIPAKMSINDNSIPLYPLSTYLGDEYGNHDINGKIYWSYCKQLDCLGHGDSEVESIISCRQGIIQKIKIMIDKKIKLPKCSKIIVKNLWV